MVDAEGPREPPREPAPPMAIESGASPEPGIEPAPPTAIETRASPEPRVEPAAEIAADPGAAPESGNEPAPQRTFELPTARHVVGSGMALAIASTREIRRASIYIGLLVLGAFGPAIVAALLILGRLGDAALDALAAVFGVEFGAPPQPALEGALLIVTLAALVGLLVFVSISIDAQVIAIALLGGRATDRPLRLWEAIVRARQAFWRMAGAGTLVGIIGFVIQSLIITALGGFSRSDEATSIAAALLATLVTTPLAYVSTSIVLGDVGAMEALSRSWRLFRARRLLAVVVTLFTLAASAIQLFAFSAGIDLVARVADFLHLSLAEGAVAFATAGVLILAGVVAYGSLTFTIGAVVAAPQVTGFLGLTFFSGGLDKARGESPRPPRGFRYVTRPMLAAFVVLIGLVGLTVPAINSIEPTPEGTSGLPGTASGSSPRPARTPGPGPTARPTALLPTTSEAMRWLRSVAAEESELIVVAGSSMRVADAAGDAPLVPGAPVTTGIDLLQGEATFLPDVPGWLLDRFSCSSGAVICGEDPGEEAAFADGALLFVHRVEADVRMSEQRTFAVLLILQYEPLLNQRSRDPFSRASRVIMAATGARPSLYGYEAVGNTLQPTPSRARALVDGPEIFTLVPMTDLPTRVLSWEVAVFSAAFSKPPTAELADELRADSLQPLRLMDQNVEVVFTDSR